jgi:hypothetical protein
MITLFIVIRQLENTYEVSFKRDRIEHFLKSSKDLRIMVKDTHVDHGLISASLLASLHAMHELQRAVKVDRVVARRATRDPDGDIHVNYSDEDDGLGCPGAYECHPISMAPRKALRPST